MLKGKKLAVIIAAAFLVISFIRKNYVVPILMYHSVCPEATAQNRLTVSVENFERQMRFLKAHKFNVLPLEVLADAIREKKRIPIRTLAITFDDGYKDNYTYAFPILKKYNLAATIFIIVNEVGRSQNDRLTWEQIKTMQDSALITFGSHALGPEPLTKIKSEEELREQLFTSKKILQEKLGKEITVFSYPAGAFNPAIRKQLIEAGYKCAVVTSPGKEYPSDDVFALKRLRISATSNNLFIFWIKTSGYYTFIKERRDAD